MPNYDAVEATIEAACRERNRHRDTLARALSAMAKTGICTPQMGYTKEPDCLVANIKELARDLDTARREAEALRTELHAQQDHGVAESWRALNAERDVAQLWAAMAAIVSHSYQHNMPQVYRMAKAALAATQPEPGVEQNKEPQCNKSGMCEPDNPAPDSVLSNCKYCGKELIWGNETWEPWDRSISASSPQAVNEDAAPAAGRGECEGCGMTYPPDQLYGGLCQVCGYSRELAEEEAHRNMQEAYGNP